MRIATLIACVLGLGSAALSAQAPTREEALEAVYPAASIKAEQLFLTPEQQTRIAMLSRAEVRSALVARYSAVRSGDVVGRAYVDTHTIRTKRESLLVALDRDGKVLRVEVTAFLEPLEFRATEIWLRQYRDKTLGNDVAVNRDIRPLAGATLTTRAVNAAVRRVLATDAVLQAGGGGR
jgi:Na+-translocating ferredoxin:NAD+ oxidoreductase RnfG subunit